VAAIRAAQLGLRTAVVEKDAKVPGVGLGGSCLHRGCIPTKAMLKAATLLDEAKHADEFGVKTSGVELDFPGSRGSATRWSSRGPGVEYQMKKNRIDVHAASDASTDRAASSSRRGGETALETRNVLVATGSVPRDLPFLRADAPRS